MRLISLDVSSSNIGTSVFEIENSQVKLTDIRNFKLDKEVEIYQRFSDFESYIDSYEIFDICFMEQRLKSFFGGQTNKNAILAISCANEVASFIVNKKCSRIEKLHPNSWRSIIGLSKKKGDVFDIKEAVIQLTIKNEIFNQYLIEKNTTLSEIFRTIEISRGINKGKEKWVQGVDDQCDSFLLGIAGIQRFIK